MFQSLLLKNEERPLGGYVVTAPDTVFSIEKWWSGEYQKKKDSYYNDNFGFRNSFVRINNQLNFWLYRKAKANGVIIGKEDYLYEENYIRAYYGTNFAGKENIEKRVTMLNKINDTLKRLNKSIVMIIAPGKGTFFPEYFPDYRKINKTTTNYEYYLSLIKKYNLNCIDFYSWFLANKNKSKYPLYPQYGVHWSTYGVCLATDSMVRYLEKLRGVNLNQFKWDGIEVTDNLRDDDYDIGKGMNLLFKLKSYKMAYPKVKIEKKPNSTPIRTIVVADSYYWLMYNYGISESIFRDSKFWYYNEEIYPESFNGKVYVKDINFGEEIKKTDVIMILSSEANMWNYGWGFIEKLYDHYFKKKSGLSYENRIKELIEKIKTDQQWFQKVKKEAVDKKMSLDSVMYYNAKWVIDNSYD